MAGITGYPSRLKYFVCFTLACLMLTSARAFTLKVGDIFVANYGSNNIIKVDPKTGAEQDWGAVIQPTDVAPSLDGFLYITSLNNTVSKLSICNGLITTLTSGGFLDQPYGLTLGPSGDLFVTSFANSLVVQVDHLTGAQTLIASSGSLSGPLGIAFNAVGNLVVANFNTSSLLEINLTNPTNGSQSVIISGNGLNYPEHLVIDASGSIYVGTDAYNNPENIIQKVTPGSTTVTNIAAGAYLRSPRGIAIEGGGKLISAQYDNKRIVRVNPADGTQSAITVVGGLLNQPYGVAVYNFPTLPPNDCNPLLDISQNGLNFVLSWQTNSTGFTLQTTLDLSSSISWSTVTNAVKVAGQNYTVTLNADSGANFFRLAK